MTGLGIFLIDSENSEREREVQKSWGGDSEIKWTEE